MSEVILDKDKFREWLESKPEGEIVGRQQACGRCPIAEYLNDLFPLQESSWIVTTHSYYPRRSLSAKWLPKWATEFILEIDFVPTPDNNFLVTREQCLGIL